MLKAIVYESSPPSLRILDQLLLPYTTTYISIPNATAAFHAIRSMQVRGAPAIAIVAALALAVELATTEVSESSEEVAVFVKEKLDYLVQSRPTAVNLADAAGKLSKIVEDKAAQLSGAVGGDAVRKAYINAAEAMLVHDVADNKAIGRHGAEWIESHATRHEGKVTVLTHCNTGSLATAGHGTALGVIRTLHERSSLSHAYCTETRPYNQGARLTAYELAYEKIPATLVTDSMAAALMRLKGISAVVVGADRVSANGDTANKIGTYALAVLARFHRVKFLIAAPRTTIDLATADGSQIVIEERAKNEVTMVKGPRWDAVGADGSEGLEGNGEPKALENVTIKIAADGVDVWNPAFDVTPADLIDGIVTEVGVVEKGSEGTFDLRSLFAGKDEDDSGTNTNE
ncbi:Methylthioribose-1-phosphate isomerase [Eremomyces bilateralis CBS 781.70]|uniref:Methylthioribose-1-phosphate isomerase n=1 Tax=Eremomyces bilateralis CBS 781.70 TaxID=1392243 RepID=A0A6G1GCW4_9PEZI|nr:Methylthioribose-1-phosphate isomerase [Eremomyces bilateralis CBS 781.70]KAF1815928.1 Methylthioribose-1-phosphate isomerase [Eremomyces bilateralis CBS 781.70]